MVVCPLFYLFWFTFRFHPSILRGRVSRWMSHVINIYTSPLNYECAINQKRVFESRSSPLNSNHIKAQGKACVLLFVMATGRLLSQCLENITHTVTCWIPLLVEPFMDMLINTINICLFLAKTIRLDIGKIYYNNSTSLMKNVFILLEL